MPELGDLAVDAIAAGTRFVTEAQPPVPRCQLVNQTLHGLRPVGDVAQEPYLPVPAASATATETFALCASIATNVD